MNDQIKLSLRHSFLVILLATTIFSCTKKRTEIEWVCKPSFDVCVETTVKLYETKLLTKDDAISQLMQCGFNECRIKDFK